MQPKETIVLFDNYLSKKGLTLDAVVIGGSALNLMGVVTRATKDCDIMDPALNVSGNLPPGWRGQLQVLFQGTALALSGLGRSDLLNTKLDAYTRRDEDLVDLVALMPTPDELRIAFDWVLTLEDSEGWPEWLEERARNVAKELGYGFQAIDRT